MESVTKLRDELQTSLDESRRQLEETQEKLTDTDNTLEKVSVDACMRKSCIKSLGPGASCSKLTTSLVSNLLKF